MSQYLSRRRGELGLAAENDQAAWRSDDEVERLEMMKPGEQEAKQACWYTM